MAILIQLQGFGDPREDFQSISVFDRDHLLVRKIAIRLDTFQAWHSLREWHVGICSRQYTGCLYNLRIYIAGKGNLQSIPVTSFPAPIKLFRAPSWMAVVALARSK